MTSTKKTILLNGIGLCFFWLIFLSGSIQSQVIDVESKEETIAKLTHKLEASSSDSTKFDLEKGLFYVYINDDADKALESALLSLKYAELAGMKNNITNCYLDIGNAYMKKEEFEKAFENFSFALQYLRENNLDPNSTLASFHIGVTYLELYLFENAKELLKKAEQDFEGARNKSLATYELTRLSLLESDTTLATEYLKKLENSIYEEHGKVNTDYLFHYSVLSELYVNMGYFDKAEQLINRTLPFIEKHNRRYYRGIVSLSLAQINLHKGELNLAIEYAKNSLTLFQLQKESFYTLKTLLLLSDLYSKNENFELSYQFLSEYTIKKDSFLKARQSAIQNRLIDQINETRFAENQLQKTEKLLQQRYYFIAVLVVLLVVVGVLMVIGFRSSKQKNKIAETISKINTDKDHFIGIVSHDLRSPLSSIMALSSMMVEESEIEKKEINEYCSIILSSSHRMEHLINNMLDANKIEMGKAKLRLEPVSLKNALAELSNSITYLGTEKDIHTELFVQNDLPEILADYNAVLRVLENLISNAYKFSPKESTVEISAKSEWNQVQVSVTDHGPGMSEHDRNKLFNKFEKLSAKPTGNEKSTGLGLYIVKTLMQEMNGTILVESEPDKGTTFTVLFNQA